MRMTRKALQKNAGSHSFLDGQMLIASPAIAVANLDSHDSYPLAGLWIWVMGREISAAAAS